MQAVALHPSYRSKATATGAGFDANYPISRVLDLRSIREVVVATSSAPSITVALAAPSAVSLIALVHHNAMGGDTYTVNFGGGDTVTGAFPSWPPSAYPATLPIPLATPRTTSGFTLSFNKASAGMLNLGGIDFGGAYSWKDVQSDMQRGYATTSQRTTQPGGGDALTRQWSPRIFKGTRTNVSRTEQETLWVDFQFAFGIDTPWVFSRDLDDPSTYVRETYLARHSTLPPATALADAGGTCALDLIEHLG